MVLRSVLLAALLASASACTPARAPEAASMQPVTLVDSAGTTTTLPADFAQFKATVVVFYADHCPCFRVHEDRLRDITRDYGDRGVRVLFVDSEVSATPEGDAKVAAERGLPPIAIDRGAKLADALGADYATFSVVFDAGGRVRYRGGIDSDKERLHDDAKHYVTEALDDLLAGREPRRTEGKALGCALKKH